MADSADMSTSNQYIKYHISVYENSTNITNNTSNVTVHVHFWRTNEYTTYGSGTVYCKINGTTHSASVGSSQKITSSGITLFNKTIDIPHNSDGTKTLTCSAWIDHSQFSSSEQSANFGLSTIPRASSIDDFKCSTSYVNGSFTVKYTPKATFNHKLRLSIPHVVAIKTIDLGSQGTGQKTATASFTSTELDGIYDRYPNGTSVIIGAVIETYSGSTKVGESSELPLTLTFPAEVKPSVSFTVAEGVADVKNKVGVYVKGLSKFYIKLTESGKNGSTISSRSVTANGATYNTTEITTGLLSSTGTLTVTATVTDSRGRTATASQNLTVYDYFKPKFISVGVNRSDANGDISDEGTNLKAVYNTSIASVNGKNKASYYLKYKESASSSWTTNTIATDTASVISGEKKIAGFAISKSYDVVLSITDLFATTELSFKLNTSFDLLNYGPTGKGIGIGKFSEKEYTVELAEGWDIISDDASLNHAVKGMPKYNLTDEQLKGIHKPRSFSSYANANVENGWLLGTNLSLGNSTETTYFDTYNAQIGLNLQNNKLYHRAQFNGTWSSWKEVGSGSAHTGAWVQIAPAIWYRAWGGMVIVSFTGNTGKTPTAGQWLKLTTMPEEFANFGVMYACVAHNASGSANCMVRINNNREIEVYQTGTTDSYLWGQIVYQFQY